MTGPGITAALDALEAERLTTVPRARRVIAADVDDVAIILTQVMWTTPRDGWSAEASEAYGRLERAVRAHGSRDDAA
jgi:hypothetical protein